MYRLHVAVYQRTNGALGHRSLAGPMLLLTTTGRKSGLSRTVPLLYVPDGDGYLVVGSNGARPEPPAWLLNLTADPRVVVQAGRRKGPATAHVLTPEEKAEVWPRMLTKYRGWGRYQELVDRELRVVSLRHDGGGGADR